MDYVKNFLSLLGIHAICSFGCLLFVGLFPGIIDFRLGQVLYSLLAVIVFFDLLFTKSWNIANKERKNIIIHNNHLKDGEQRLKMTYKKGIALGCAYLVLNIIVFVLSFAFSHENSGLSIAIFRIWFCEFIVAFMYSVRHIRHISFLVSIFPAVPIILGYINGAHGINVIETFMNKIVYKSEPAKDEKK